MRLVHRALVGAQQPAFAQRCDPVHGREQLAWVRAGGAGGLLVDRLVGISVAGDRRVGAPAVGDHRAAGLDILADELGERDRGGISQRGHPAPAGPPWRRDLNGDAGEHLLAVLPAAAQPRLLPADVGLIHLDHPGQPVPARAHQHLPQPVQHRPRRLVRADLQRPLQVLSGDPVLGRGEQPAGVKPHRQRRAGLVEDGARRQRGPGAATAALDPAVTKPPATSMTATWADEPVRPAQPLQVIQAVLIGPEPGKELPSRARIVRASLTGI